MSDILALKRNSYKEFCLKLPTIFLYFPAFVLFWMFVFVNNNHMKFLELPRDYSNI